MIFKHKDGFSFAWCGGRFLILDRDNHLTDFGDGGLSHGKGGGNIRIHHEYLGDLHAKDTLFDFKDYGIVFDFSDLENSHHLNSKPFVGDQPASLYEFRKFHIEQKTNTKT